VKKERMWIVGHRGAMGHAPENTRASFEKALRLGADAVECDVHRSKDGETVVLHDGRLDRTTNGRGPVRSRTWAQLRKLDAGAWFAPRFKKERLWRLGDLIRWARRKKTRAGRPLNLIVEIKTSPDSPRRLPAAVVEALAAGGMVDRTIVISFDPRAVRAVKARCPALRAGLLFSNPLPGLTRRMAALGADAIFPKHTLIDRALMTTARRHGWFVGTWTANETAELRRLSSLGVHAAATNYPERAPRPRS